LDKPKELLYSHPETKLTKQQLLEFQNLIARRSQGEPVAYLQKTKEFYGLNFFVDKRVLIPRPETELLVEEVLKIIQSKNYKPKTVADIGTGSGCIIISLAKNVAASRKRQAVSFHATDISKPALAVAKLNAKKHKVKIKFYHGDLFKPLKNKKIDIITANLPYLDNYYKSSKNPGLKFEPKTALEGYQQGLAVYEKLFRQMAGLKPKPKIIICEFGPTQAKKMEKLIKKYLPQYRIIIKKDLAKLNRMAIIQS
jgi:release factor glutamine methyltransferase